MKYTVYGKDWLEIDEQNYLTEKETNHKLHLLKLCFNEPTYKKIATVMDNFPKTNRYIIDDNIRYYNGILKGRKKYYVANREGDKLFSFFKRNNKILLDFDKLTTTEHDFIIENIEDILSNVEVIKTSKMDELSNFARTCLNEWNGNVLI